MPMGGKTEQRIEVPDEKRGLRLFSFFLLPSSCEKFNSVAELLFIADFEIVPREFVELLARAQAMDILDTSPSINGSRLLFCKQKLERKTLDGGSEVYLKLNTLRM